ncbi:MAG: class I SAM-dependent methyltransferase [Chloroflexi bacterium]|nr:class I SAM-dependent methyltransferase [Chloroflexota bacterium]
MTPREGPENPTTAAAHEREIVGCNLCSADDPDHVLSVADDWLGHFGGTFPLVRCRACGLCYLRERPTSQALVNAYASEQMQRSIDHRADPLSERLFWVRAWLRRRELERWVRPGYVLDVGCGGGEFLAVLAAGGWEVAGTEVDGRRVVDAERRLGPVVRRTPLERAGFSEGSFDAVTLWHVLEHVPDPLATLKLAIRLVRPGGVLAVATPNVESLEARAFGINWSGLVAPWHLYYFSPDTLGRMVHLAGGEVLALSEPIAYYSLLQSFAHARRRRQARGVAAVRLAVPFVGRILGLLALDRRWRGPSVTLYARQPATKKGLPHGAAGLLERR